MGQFSVEKPVLPGSALSGNQHTVVVQPPRTPDALRKNPLGIFVNALNWSKELSQ